MQGCRVFALIACFILVGAAAHGATVCINEVLYDPIGADGGHEFVELYNAGNAVVRLEGWLLEAGNGARPDDWRTVWRGTRDQVVAPGGFFLIAGAQVVGPADERVVLSLQNGPDGVRLRSPEGGADVVGWGDLPYLEYCEGQPAEDVPSGWVLCRVPDGHDTGDNLTDLISRPLPTPGKGNAAPCALIVGPARCDPPLADPEGTVKLVVPLCNAGTEPIEMASLAWSVQGGVLELEAQPKPSGVLGLGSSRELVWTLRAPLVDGVETVGITVRAAKGCDGEASIRVRTGCGPVVISELLYDPLGDEGEWVELQNLSARPVDLGGWRLVDASGRATVLGSGDAELMPGAWKIVAQDTHALRARWPELASDLVAERSGGWPSLNNTIDSQLGYADQIVIEDATGLVVDYVRYAPGGLDGAGVSLERWIEGDVLVDPRLLVPCASPGGATPGGSSWLRATGESGDLWLEPQPQPFRPDRPGEPHLCRIAIPRAAGGGGRVTADVFSMAGRRVATLAAGAEAHGPVVLVWNGSSAGGEPLPTGLYLIRVVLQSAAGSRRSYLRTLPLIRDS